MSNNKVKQMRVTEKEHSFLTKIRSFGSGYVLPKEDIKMLMGGLMYAVDRFKDNLRNVEEINIDGKYEENVSKWKDEIMKYEVLYNELLDKLYIE